jgi:hypothetical protein
VIIGNQYANIILHRISKIRGLIRKIKITPYKYRG